MLRCSFGRNIGGKMCNTAAVSGPSLVTMVINIGSFFVIAGLSGFLADKLGETQKLLKEKQIDFQELDAFKEALLQGIGSGVAITDRRVALTILISKRRV